MKKESNETFERDVLKADLILLDITRIRVDILADRKIEILGRCG